MASTEYSIYTIRFGLICLSSLFFSTSYNMLIPELPAYLEALGGSRYIGLIIALFTLTAGLSRPFSGKLTDTIGRKPVIIIGVLVCMLSGLLYTVIATVSGFLLLRLFHGFSTGFSPTAISAYVSDIIPSHRWGEALGVQGLFFSTGLALGPTLGSFIKLHYTFDVLFYTSSAIAFLSLVFMLNSKESLSNPQIFKFSEVKISKKDIIAKEVLPAAYMTLVSYFSFGVILTLIPIWTSYLGIINKGVFFIIFAVSSLLIRFVAGKISDTYSRLPVILLGLGLLLCSLCVMGGLQSKFGLYFAATIYGLAMGVLSPTLNAWTIDLSIPKQRGKGIATMYIALEAGIGLGALCSGWYFQDDISRIPIVFFTCAVLTLLGFIYMLINKKSS